MHCLLPCSHVVKTRCVAQPALSLLCDQYQFDIYQFISFDVYQLNIYEFISLQSGSVRVKQKLCLEIRSVTSGSEGEAITVQH
jgi:hypothetical protein